MRIHALVPVKQARDGKGRLAAVLSPAEREILVAAMLRDVLRSLVQCHLLTGVAVISPDVELLRLAERLGARSIAEPPGTRGLNAALDHGRSVLAADGAEGVLIVQGDVPSLSTEAVSALLHDGMPPLVRCAPSTDGGTGALLLLPPDVVALAFGPQSFALHRSAAERAGAAFQRFDEPLLALDLDTPADLARFLAGAPDGEAAAFLGAIAVDGRLPAMSVSDQCCEG